MPKTKITEMQNDLIKIGYSKTVAQHLAPKLQRRLDFEQCAQLFAMDPTAMVAALRSLGYDVPAKYAAMAVAS